MFLHVFYSWLIAQVFHPLLFMVLFYLSHGYVSHIDAGDIFVFLVISTIASSPCLLLGWLFLGVIVYSGYTGHAKFFLWLGTSAALVFLNFWCIILFFDPNILREYFVWMIPGILSIWISSILRFRQFQELIDREISMPDRDLIIE